MSKFIGRKNEFNTLSQFFKKKSASLIVVRGRRRIGKSRLIEEFAKGSAFYSFSGIPPTSETTAQSQRNEFALQLGQMIGMPDIFAADWSTLFLLLAKHIEKERTVVLCGSASSWIEKNILSSTGFVGRISFTLTLEELPLIDCYKFWGVAGKNIATYEKLKVLSVTGGIPKYLEEIDPAISAEENIKKLGFTKGGFLFSEFDHIFSENH